MADRTLSAKLGELDKKLNRMRQRVASAAAADDNQLAEEIRALRNDCAEHSRALYEKLRHSKTDATAVLAQAYFGVEEIIGRTEERLGFRGIALPSAGANDGGNAWRDPAEENPRENSAPTSTEEKLLTAEYAIDFVMQAADRALLVSLEAVSEEKNIHTYT